MGTNKLLLLFLIGLLAFSACQKEEPISPDNIDIEEPVTPAIDPEPLEYFKARLDDNDLSFHLKTSPNFIQSSSDKLYMGMSKDANTRERFEVEFELAQHIDWWTFPKTFVLDGLNMEDTFVVKYTTPSGKEFTNNEHCHELNDFQFTATSFEDDMLEGEFSGTVTLENCAVVNFENGSFRIKLLKQ